MAQLELVHPAPLDMTNAQPRGDHFVISQMVSDGARVLDVGCADGALMQLLKKECSAKVRGLEIDPNKPAAKFAGRDCGQPHRASD